MSWISVGAAAVGVGANLYGASQQRVANNKAQDTNAARQKEQNDAAWTNWLLTRGISPTTPVAAGVMPTQGNYNVVNQRLPLWATLQRPTTTTTPAAPGTKQPAW